VLCVGRVTAATSSSRCALRARTARPAVPRVRRVRWALLTATLERELHEQLAGFRRPLPRRAPPRVRGPDEREPPPVTAPEEQLRTRQVERRRNDDDRPPAARPRDTRNRLRLSARVVRTGGEAQDSRVRKAPRPAQPPGRLPPRGQRDAREREHGCDVASYERERRRQALRRAGKDDDGVRMGRRPGLCRRPDEEHRARAEPQRHESGEDEE